MPKPTNSWTLKQLKDYVRSHKLNKPEIKISMKKADLTAGLKKHGHWEGSKTITKSEFTKARQGLRKAVAPKKKTTLGRLPSKKKTAPKKKVETVSEAYKRFSTDKQYTQAPFNKIKEWLKTAEDRRGGNSDLGFIKWAKEELKKREAEGIAKVAAKHGLKAGPKKKVRFSHQLPKKKKIDYATLPIDTEGRRGGRYFDIFTGTWEL
jgi:hypothetical protein